MNNELELVKVQADKIRWMITQLENSCDGSDVMINYILEKKAQMKETIERIVLLSA